MINRTAVVTTTSRSNERGGTLVRTAARWILVGSTALGCLLGATDDASARGKIPVLIQITNNTEGQVFSPKIRSQDGNRIVFTSTGDVTGPAPAQQELYIYDVDTGTTIKATDTPGHGVKNAARSTDQVFAGERPEFVAFASTADLDSDGDPNNADGNQEIFIYEWLSGTFHQLTDTVAPVVNDEVYPSDSGKCIVFSSTGDMDNNETGNGFNNPPTGYENADGSKEIFLYTSNGFLAREGLNVHKEGTWSTVWNPDGSIQSQHQGTGLFGQSEDEPPWHNGVQPQTKPTAPWWSEKQ